MSANNPFVSFSPRELLVREAQRMVFQASMPCHPGELSKVQIDRAAKRLGLKYGTVRRAWYLLSGPEIFPTIEKAWQQWAINAAAKLQQDRAEWAALQMGSGFASHPPSAAMAPGGDPGSPSGLSPLGPALGTPSR